MPYILIPLDAWKQVSVYVFFVIIALIASVVAWKVLVETMEQDLDNEQ